MNLNKVRNIWAVGRNYLDHAKELGNQVPYQPLIFLKAGSTIQPDTDELVFPDWAQNIHFEVEVALQFSDSLQFDRAFLAVDFTERTLQSQLKEKSHPWTLAKSFPGATAVSAPLDMTSLEELNDFSFELLLNDELKQSGNTKGMVFDCNFLMNYVRGHFPVCPGDLLLTGTPAGVGPIENADRLEIRCRSGVQQSWVVNRPQTRKI